ncbi:MAG: hypothetical protein M1819_000959 [Sarea resinae]|nr:MAG: hypothetical protein M1819_000959 [Sarea resinae]
MSSISLSSTLQEGRIPTYKKSQPDAEVTDPIPVNEKSSNPSTESGQRRICSPDPCHQPLATKLRNVRGSRIHGLMTIHISPALEDLSLQGIHKASFVLVPSNAFPARNVREEATDADADADADAGETSDTVAETAEEIIGYPAQEAGGLVRVVRLEGEGNTLEFWSQGIVIQELQRDLNARYDAVQGETSKPSLSIRSSAGHFSRERSAGRPLGSSQADLRTPKERSLRPGDVRFDVRLDEVCFRSVSELGLYESQSGRVIVIDAEIGG